MVKPRVLFASSSLEASHVPVRQLLEARGAQVVVFAIDRVFSGDEHFAVRVGTNSMPEVTYRGVSIGPDQVDAAWYWKPASFRVPGAKRNVAKQLSLVNEITQMNSSVWGLYPDDLWLNCPAATWAANQKLPQLLRARDVGFAVPQTLMTNCWGDVTNDFFEVGVHEVVAKMHRGVIADHDTVKAMYTTALIPETVERLSSTASPFPALIQPFLSKKREWRVTVVGERVFAAAIYAEPAAREDWRRLQLDPTQVQFRREVLPDDVAERCVAFLVRSSLRYGAFDLVETPAGEFVFLECNPSGQFMWLADAIGSSIVEALVDALWALAMERAGPLT